MLSIIRFIKHRLYLSRRGFKATPRRVERLPVPSRLTIPFGATPLEFRASGDFPRRVEAGDTLAVSPLESATDLPLLAPLPGIAYYEEEDETFQLRVEGAVPMPDAQAAAARREGILAAQKPRRAFYEMLCSHGIPSLEFPGCSLEHLFRSARKRDPWHVVLSAADAAGGIPWHRVLSHSRPTVTELARFLGDVFVETGPTLHVDDEGWTRSARVHNHGYEHPVSVARRLIDGLRSDVPLHEQGVVFIGAPTLRALLLALYESRPFGSRIVSLNIERGIRSNSGLFEIWHGQDIASVFAERLPRKPKLFASPHAIATDARSIGDAAYSNYSLYSFSSVFVRRQAPTPALNLPCTSCGVCNAICPVGAYPMQLPGGAAGFRRDLCIDCDLCSVACESSIDLKRMILETQGTGATQ